MDYNRIKLRKLVLTSWLVLTECDVYFSINFCLPGLGTNQNLSCWGSSGQSEAQLLGTTGAVAGFHTKPPIIPYFYEFHSVIIHVLRVKP